MKSRDNVEEVEAAVETTPDGKVRLRSNYSCKNRPGLIP